MLQSYLMCFWGVHPKLSRNLSPPSSPSSAQSFHTGPKISGCSDLPLDLLGGITSSYISHPFPGEPYLGFLGDGCPPDEACSAPGVGLLLPIALFLPEGMSVCTDKHEGSLLLALHLQDSKLRSSMEVKRQQRRLLHTESACSPTWGDTECLNTDGNQ